MMVGYKKYIGILLFLPVLASGAPEPEAEIVIELTGTPAPATPAGKDISIWEHTCPQLAKLLRGKTREKALYQITSVSTQDKPITAQDGTRYRFVQYGQEGEYRKLLFLAKEPQLFIACASNPPEILDIAVQYKTGLGLTETEFLNRYAQETAAVFLPVSSGQSLYELHEPGKEPQFLLFEHNLLNRILNKTEADKLVQQQEEALAASRQKTQPVQKPAPKKPYTVLLDGGTLHDRLYRPRLVNPQDFPELPRLVPNDIPPGTPLWPQEVFRQQPLP